MSAKNAIASGSAILTANADGLTATLNKAEKDLNTFGKTAGAKLGSPAGARGLLGRLWNGTAEHDARTGKYLGQIGGLKGKVLPVAAAFAVAGVAANKFLGDFMEVEDHFGKIEDFADNVGMSVEGFSSLGHAADLAGVDMATLEGGLQRFRLNVEGDLDTALAQFADRLKDVEDPGERARLLVENFGKSGVRMGKMFEGGAEGLKKMQDEARELGIAITKEQAEQMGAAGDAVNNAKKAFKGAGQQIMAALAPGVEKIANMAGALVKWLKPAFDWFGRWFTRTFELNVFLFEQIATGVKMVVNGVGEFLGGMFGITGEMPTIQDAITGVWRAIGTTGAWAWDIIKFGAGAATVAASKLVEGFGLLVGAFKDVVGLAKELPERLRPEGLDAFIAGVERFDKGVDGTAARMKAWGEGAMNGLGKSAADFNRALDDALKPKEKGKELGKEMADGIEEELEPIKLSAALLRGSKEAYSLIVANQMRGLESRDEPAKKMVKAQQEGNKKLAKIERNGKRVADRLDELGDF